MDNYSVPVSDVWKRGHKDAGEFIEILLAEAKKRQAEEYLERLVLEAEQSGEAVPWPPEDWANLRRELQERMARR